MIDVKEGATVDVVVKGKRVAFSCYGLVTSLNGEPEKEIALEAVGMGSCEGMQEETRSDKDGTYRLRGLQVRDGTYRLRGLQVSGSDVTNVNMIVFRRRNQFEITGTVASERDHLHTLKVMLYRENNLDTPVLTTSVGIAGYFQFQPVPNDGEVYVVRLDSSLSTKTFVYTLPEATVTSTGIRSHVKLIFAPKSRTFEQEPSQGSLLALPFLAILALLFINHSKIFPVMQQAAQMLQGVPAADQ
ncbi:predicted protein, partial [Nematostella vectensis]